jgi:hypothetical protein
MINLCNEYFKSTIEEIYKNNLTTSDIDLFKVQEVENSHYYLPFFNDIANKVYYIDYPDNLNSIILDTYINKRWHGADDAFLNAHITSIPFTLRKNITANNVRKTFEVLWLKHLKIWRTINNIEAINFKDLFNINQTTQLVELLTQKPITNKELFNSTYQTWQRKNQNLIQLCL